MVIKVLWVQKAYWIIKGESSIDAEVNSQTIIEENEHYKMICYHWVV